MSGDQHQLLDAMLAMLQRKGIPAATVTGYTECSYNLGYCETCSEMATSVRILYVARGGQPAHWDYEYEGLGALIRELTDEPAERAALEAVAVRETEDERWDRYGEAHSVDEALAVGAVSDAS